MTGISTCGAPQQNILVVLYFESAYPPKKCIHADKFNGKLSESTHPITNPLHNSAHTYSILLNLIFRCLRTSQE